MTGAHAGHIVFIPGIALTITKDCHLPFTFTRRQFPIKPSYAMTIVTGSNFEKSWNLSSTVRFHLLSVVCSCVKS